MTIREVLNQATRLLEDHRISHPRLTAEVLLSHHLRTDRAYLVSHDTDVLPSETQNSYEAKIRLRISGTPLQYITGTQEFYGRSFVVTPDVLIPRPETEHLIEYVLQLSHQSRPRIVDVGAGSGCVGITLALEIPDSYVVGTDISVEALRIAARNAHLLGATMHFVGCDLLMALTGPFDIIASNPPYVSFSERTSVQREVREHEPLQAVFAPGDPIDLYRNLARQAHEALRPGGLLVMEIGFGMEERVMNLFERGWVRLPAKTDLQGIPRTIAVTRA